MSEQKMVRLRDLGVWSGGNTPSKARADFWSDGVIPWVSPKDMKVHELSSSEDLISETALQEGRVSLLPAGAVLIVTRSGILSHSLPVAVTKVPVTINQDIKALVPHKDVCPRYVAHALRGASQRILKTCSKHGTTVASVETAALLDFEIPLLPLDQQRKVVAEIEKQFSRLDEAVANLQRVKANLKRYKASVLKAAVEGRLTEGNVDSFRRLRLGEIVELNPRLPKNSLDDTSSVTFVPMAAVGADDGHLDVTAIRSYSEVRKGYTYFADGDVLFAKVTPCMENGKIAIAKGLLGGIGFGSTEFHVMRPRHDVDSRYVYCIVSSESFRKKAARHMTGAVGLRRVPTAFLESVEVSVPPLDQQLLVVSEVDRQLTIIQEIEAEVDVNLQRSKVLRQATLAKAFLNR